MAKYEVLVKGVMGGFEVDGNSVETGDDVVKIKDVQGTVVFVTSIEQLVSIKKKTA